MKSNRFFLPLLILVLSLSSSAVPAPPQAKKKPRELTLGEVRSMLIGKKVVIIGKTSQEGVFKGYLYEWSIEAKAGGEERRAEVTEHLPDSYQGKEAEVIAVGLNRAEKERSGVGGVNALGETSSDESLVNPYCDIVVKFTDGTIAKTTSYLSLILSDDDVPPFRLLAEKHDRAALINGQLPSVIGKTIYAAGYSNIFLPTASLESLMSTSRYGNQRAYEFPRLQLLTIVKAVYNEDKDVIIIKLRDENGKEYLALSNFDARDKEKNFLATVVESSSAFLHVSVTDLTAREIEAVKKGSIFVGMSKKAVYWTVGFPEKENDWGRGGKQFIYFGGKLNVYLDETEHVKDWQSVDR